MADAAEHRISEDPSSDAEPLAFSLAGDLPMIALADAPARVDRPRWRSDYAFRFAAAMPSILVLLMAVLGAGCGYVQNGLTPTGGYQWKSLYRGDVSTVAVPIFSNRSYYREVEFGLTKAVINQLEAQTPYKVVPKERADTILEGSIENVHVRTLSLDQHGAVIPQEQLFVFTVNFTWTDLRTGKVLVDRRDFEQSAPYYPTLGEDQFVAQQQSVETLAGAIVHQLQADW